MPKHLVAIAVLALMPIYADAAPGPVRMQWEGLATLMGKTVKIAMPGGTVITGTATGFEPEAFLVKVKNTTDAKAYPKGPVRVPRATLHYFQMQSKGKAFRIAAHSNRLCYRDGSRRYRCFVY